MKKITESNGNNLLSQKTNLLLLRANFQNLYNELLTFLCLYFGTQLKKVLPKGVTFFSHQWGRFFPYQKV